MIREYCIHGAPHPTCDGSHRPDIAPCADDEYYFCPHGVDLRIPTTDGTTRCPTCRGVNRRERNKLR